MANESGGKAEFSVGKIRNGLYAWTAWRSRDTRPRELAPSSGTAATEEEAVAAAQAIAGADARRVENFWAVDRYRESRRRPQDFSALPDDFLWVCSESETAGESWHPHLVVKRTDRFVYVTAPGANLAREQASKGGVGIVRLDRVKLEAEGRAWGGRKLYYTPTAKSAHAERTLKEAQDAAEKAAARKALHFPRFPGLMRRPA